MVVLACLGGAASAEGRTAAPFGPVASALVDRAPVQSEPRDAVPQLEATVAGEFYEPTEEEQEDRHPLMLAGDAAGEEIETQGVDRSLTLIEKSEPRPTSVRHGIDARGPPDA